MTSTTILFESLYWIAVLASLTAALIFAVLTAIKRDFVWVAAGLLALALILVALSSTPVPFGMNVLLGLLCLAVSVFGGGPAVLITLGLANGEDSAGAHGGILVQRRHDMGVSVPGSQQEVLRGGATIGVLERLAATAAIIAGHPEAIAIIVALKSVGRFTELDAAEARERFIIGSLVSLMWACASAAVFVIALH